MTRRRTLGLAWLLAAQCIGALAQASAIDTIDAHEHLGVASCANSVCHGASQPFRDSAVMQNEFSVWQESDPHAQSYRTLETPRSKAIARKLGLGDPTQAKVCLDCHADNIGPHLRGERFQITDGVGCEACHGGAEPWLNAHADRSVTHAANIANGMYPTDQPIARAELCLSCHMGSKQRPITHRVMGAGHPRLSFELDTFTWLHPHYTINAAWIKRKGEWNGVRDWAVGQGVAAGNLLDLLVDEKTGWNGIFPELVLFNCHACHRLMNANQWGPRPGTGLGPGAVPLNDANLVMFRHVLAPVDKAAAARVGRETRALHSATTQSRGATFAAARRLHATLTELLPKVAAFDYGPDDFNVILASIEADARRGEYRDYAAAEQVAMAAQSLTVAFENDGKLDEKRSVVLHARLDAVYAVLKDENRYDMRTFDTALKALQDRMP
jgi:hypothetical protein